MALTERYQTGYEPSMNEIIAVGRSFKTTESFSAFLEYCSTLQTVNRANVGWYWWSFFRCFYYFSETVFADENLVEVFFEKMLRFLRHNRQEHARVGGPSSLGSQIKFCLCAVLFGLRIREMNPTFLSDGSVLQKDLIEVITRMNTQIRIPPMAGQVAEAGLTFNGLVVRFLKHEATEDDVGLVNNVTQKMS